MDVLEFEGMDMTARSEDGCCSGDGNGDGVPFSLVIRRVDDGERLFGYYPTKATALRDALTVLSLTPSMTVVSVALRHIEGGYWVLEPTAKKWVKVA